MHSVCGREVGDGVCLCLGQASNKFIQNLCSENSLQIYSLDLVTLSFGRDIYSFIFCKSSCMSG